MTTEETIDRVLKTGCSECGIKEHKMFIHAKCHVDSPVEAYIEEHNAKRKLVLVCNKCKTEIVTFYLGGVK